MNKKRRAVLKSKHIKPNLENSPIRSALSSSSNLLKAPIGHTEPSLPGGPSIGPPVLSPVWPPIWPPVWYDPLSPLGSAVHYIATLSPHFNWVGIYLLKGKTLVLGPYLGAKTEHTRIPVGKGICGTAIANETDMNVPDVKRSKNYLACSIETKSELVILIRDSKHPKNPVIGQIDIDSHTLSAFTPELESKVKAIGVEIGNYWSQINSQAKHK